MASGFQFSEMACLFRFNDIFFIQADQGDATTSTLGRWTSWTSTFTAPFLENVGGTVIGLYWHVLAVEIFDRRLEVLLVGDVAKDTLSVHVPAALRIAVARLDPGQFRHVYFGTGGSRSCLASASARCCRWGSRSLMSCAPGSR